MQYIWQHIENIISSYKGELPLAHFLKQYYKQYPKLGSRDRRMLSEMTYSWYRCGKAADKGLSIQEQLATCLCMCRTENNRLLQLIEGIPTQEVKSLESLFPHDLQLSQGIEKDEWLNSMLRQPDLFIRIRREHKKVLALLDGEEVPYKVLTGDCIALPNGTPIDTILPGYVYVVQDASSQKTGAFFGPKPHEHWWDCCSGAGGKSLLVKDKEPLIDVTATDTRKTILNNLKERFRTYSHILPKTFVADVTNAARLEELFANTTFDNIICDVPCTGSGTWARTPEQLFFFKPGSTDTFSDVQKKIAVNACAYLKPGGKLHYITCSVFKKENEEVVQKIIEATGVVLSESLLINGTQHKADSMFIAVLQKPA